MCMYMCVCVVYSTVLLFERIKTRRESLPPPPSPVLASRNVTVFLSNGWNRRHAFISSIGRLSKERERERETSSLRENFA